MLRSDRLRTACLAAVVGLAVVCLGCGIFPTSPQTLLKQAQDAPTLSERRQALVELKGRATPAMRVALESILARELDPASRALAADLLGEIGDPASGPELSKSVRRDTRWVVRKRALEAECKVLGPGAADDIAYVLKNDSSPEVRVEAVLEARRCLKPADAKPLLLEALSDSAPAVRLEASAMLKELTGLDAAPNAESWQAALKAAKKP